MVGGREGGGVGDEGGKGVGWAMRVGGGAGRKPETGYTFQQDCFE